MDDKKPRVTWEEIEPHINNINAQIKTISEHLSNINQSFKQLHEVALRKYECEYYSLRARPNSCFFCDHCTDIFFDQDGPYAFVCDEEQNVELGLSGMCSLFIET